MRTHRLFTILSLGAAAACSSTNEPAPNFGTPAALITVAFQGIPHDTLVVYVSDSATISAAERYVANHTGPRLVTGTIVRGAGSDQRYPFQFKPESVRIVDAAIEICDGAPMRTADEVDTFIELSTGSRQTASATWCPWSSYPIKVQRVLPD